MGGLGKALEQLRELWGKLGAPVEVGMVEVLVRGCTFDGILPIVIEC